MPGQLVHVGLSTMLVSWPPFGLFPPTVAVLFCCWLLAPRVPCGAMSLWPLAVCLFALSLGWSVPPPRVAPPPGLNFGWPWPLPSPLLLCWLCLCVPQPFWPCWPSVLPCYVNKIYIEIIMYVVSLPGDFRSSIQHGRVYPACTHIIHTYFLSLRILSHTAAEQTTLHAVDSSCP